MISAPSAALGLVYRWTDRTPNPTGEARAVLRRVLKDLGLSGDVVSDGVLAVSELVANAHEHACGPYEVYVHSAAGRYICEIHDGDPLLPTGLYLGATPSPDTEPADGAGGSLVERGRGLRIVNELAQGQWGFHVTERGAKAAWIVLATALADPPDGKDADGAWASYVGNEPNPEGLTAHQIHAVAATAPVFDRNRPQTLHVPGVVGLLPSGTCTVHRTA
ncbi:ATP-binding protein [Streptomyces sp. TRM49041]|uniref:ATP-binding protein n=1 Tax=Streptomyces sp. TRM49041 TaxID=2603216 RepID=UPI0011EE7B73|nr:ATP-binding protein [Streptomyces sp. TRM49041]